MSRAHDLIQAEHLPAIAALMQCERSDPAALRRNLCISGITTQVLQPGVVPLHDAVSALHD